MKTQKLSFYALGAALALTAASCSNDLPGNHDEVYDGPTTTNYLTVNLVAGGEQGTRASYNEGNEGTYEDGSAVENAVSSVRFYFFDEEGNAANVKSNSGALQNYWDWTPDESKSEYPDEDSNVEKILQAEIVISTAAGDKIPSSIIAVVNPTETVKAQTISSISGAPTANGVSLNSVMGDYDVTATGPFMMSNSIYLNAQNQLQEEVSVENHLHTSAGAALADPVTIYVERVNAKAQTTCTLNGTSVTVEDEDGEGESFTIYDISETTNPVTNSNISPDDVLQQQKVYVRFLGWNVTCTTNKSYLMKEIGTDPAVWNNTDLFGSATATDWNSPTRYRSFWAINPSLVYDRTGVEGMDYNYGNFWAAQELTSFTSGASNYTYLQENAALSASSTACAHPTQLIVAGQLVDQNGKPIALAEYGFNQYTPEGLLTVLAGRSNVYTKETVDGKVKFKTVDPQYLTFVTAIEAGQGNVNTDGRYYSYVNLINDENVQIPELYVGTDPNAAPATVEEINTSLEGLGHAKVWTNGYTYYYVDIRHLGNYTPATDTAPAVSFPGSFGIVRNHIYDMTISSIKGLGTPVGNPNEVIYPEMPKDEDTYIGAQINILTWRLVSQNVGFAW